MSGPPPDEGLEELSDVRHALRERVKELSCLYDASAILADGGRALPDRLRALVDRIPAGWLHPERTGARLVLEGLEELELRSAGWSDAPPRLRAPVSTGSEHFGHLEVSYRRDGAEAAAGRDATPEDAELEAAAVFLDEERLLLQELAHRVAGTLQARSAPRRASRADAPAPAAASAAPAPPVTTVADADFGLVGESPPLRALRDAIRRAARTDATILVLGESGTGKELVARAIHYASPRSTAPFVAVNCAAIPESLVEAELFGYVKGAFTGASHARAGFFQTADGGTIFLDEIGEMSLGVQAKLLRVLEHAEIRMVGADRSQRVDTRIVAATHQNLPALVEAGRFRADLYFRLHVLSVELPPLRERGADLLLLLHHFQEKWGPRSGGAALEFTPAAERALLSHDWPGNVRELENLVRRLSILSPDGSVDRDDLPSSLREPPATPAGPTLTLAEVERRHVRAVLDSVDGNRSQAARLLGIDRKTLRKKLVDPESDESA